MSWLSRPSPIPQERFKELEREMKIKPFAKAGLVAKEKIDADVLAKLECLRWLRGAVYRLAEQREQHEV